jgi:ElaB/YqjD/DUF883 family membrane-anchored ribosome-binding protein
MKKQNKVMVENLEKELLPYFKGLCEKSAVKMIKHIESSLKRMVKKFNNLLENDGEDLDDSEKKEVKKLRKEAEKQKKDAKKLVQEAKINIVTSKNNDDIIQEAT